MQRPYNYEISDLENVCLEYIELILEEPNAWGQNVHRIYGPSHRMRSWMYDTFGKDTVDNKIDKLL